MSPKKRTPNIEDGRDWKITKTPGDRFTAYLMDTLVGEDYLTWDEAVEAIEGVAEEMGIGSCYSSELDKRDEDDQDDLDDDDDLDEDEREQLEHGWSSHLGGN